jgi:hypothetical protein
VIDPTAAFPKSYLTLSQSRPRPWTFLFLTDLPICRGNQKQDQQGKAVERLRAAGWKGVQEVRVKGKVHYIDLDTYKTTKDSSEWFELPHLWLALDLEVSQAVLKRGQGSCILGSPTTMPNVRSRPPAGLTHAYLSREWAPDGEAITYDARLSCGCPVISVPRWKHKLKGLSVATRGRHLPGYNPDTKVARPHKEGCKKQGRAIKAKSSVCLLAPFVQRKGSSLRVGRKTGVRFGDRESLVARLDSVAEARRREACIADQESRQ